MEQPVPSYDVAQRKVLGFVTKGPICRLQRARGAAPGLTIAFVFSCVYWIDSEIFRPQPPLRGRWTSPRSHETVDRRLS